jgi:hypothetical protein
MASRAQIDRLSLRIEALAVRVVPVDEPPPERWILDGDRAYELSNPNQVITVAEMGARPTKRTSLPTRIVREIVDPVRVENAQ